MRNRTHQHRVTQTGVSLLEILISLCVGLFIVATGFFAWSEQTRATQQLVLRAQLIQALRSTSQLMTRDLRRTQYWSDAAEQAYIKTNAQGFEFTGQSKNPHTLNVTPEATLLSYSTPQDDTTRNEGTTESFGYRLHQGVIEMQLGHSAWQSMTDPHTLTITRMDMTQTTHTTELHTLCAQNCHFLSSTAQCPPQYRAHTLQLHLEGHATRDPSLTEHLQTSIVLGNGSTLGECGT
jgi:prepilin peptidase dependent protein B